MIDRNDPDLSKKLFASGKIGEINHGPSRIVFASFEIIKNQNAWIPLHDGSVFDKTTLADWELLIPQYGCGCKRFYSDWKADNPPDFTSPDAFFAWGVRLHNAVNAKLGKPEITIDEARLLWRKDNADTKNSGTDLP